MQVAGFPSIAFTESDISSFQDDIALNGLPAFLTDALVQLGADAATVDEISDLLLAVDPVAGSFPESLTDAQLISTLQETAQAVDAFATSITAPTGVVNGGFETGDFTGWQQINSGSGGIIIDDGGFNPPGPGAAVAPFQGGFASATFQSGPGVHTAGGCSPGS